MGQKTLVASLKYKIAIRGIQTLTKHVLNPENTFQGFPMAEFTPLKVSTWIKKLDPSRSMVLEGLPTRVMMMMMMMMAMTLRQLLATSRGRSVTGDPIDKKKKKKHSTNVQHTYFSFSFISMYFCTLLL